MSHWWHPALRHPGKQTHKVNKTVLKDQEQFHFSDMDPESPSCTSRAVLSESQMHPWYHQPQGKKPEAESSMVLYCYSEHILKRIDPKQGGVFSCRGCWPVQITPNVTSWKELNLNSLQEPQFTSLCAAATMQKQFSFLILRVGKLSLYIFRP